MTLAENVFPFSPRVTRGFFCLRLRLPLAGSKSRLRSVSRAWENFRAGSGEGEGARRGVRGGLNAVLQETGKVVAGPCRLFRQIPRSACPNYQLSD